MGCNGDCCIAFPVSSSPDRMIGFRHPGSALEALTILGMIEPLTLAEAVERRKRFALNSELIPDPKEKYYKCRHWDEATRLCSKYEERPWMCRTYPNCDKGDVCEHGCDCKGQSLEEVA
jgi:Fe-S-cluster containining protein